MNAKSVKRFQTLLLAWVGSLVCQTADAADRQVFAQPGLFTVEVARFDWNDAKRNRPVPAKVYFPKDGTGSFPLIVFSHGLGGTRETYEYLGRHWASHGYISVHIQHEGSDDEVWRGSAQPMQDLRASAANLQNAVDRPRDVSFAIDQMLALAASDARFRGRTDTNRIGVAGHSFGAYTTMAVAGQAFGLRQISLADSRVYSAIAMSTPVPRSVTKRNYQQVRIPIFHLTGTADDSPIGDTPAARRRDPFDHISSAPQYLLTFTGGDHMVFSGRSGLRGDRSKDAEFHQLILGSTTAFWDAQLKGNEAAKSWLEGEGFNATLRNHGVFETKPNKADQPKR